MNLSQLFTGASRGESRVGEMTGRASTVAQNLHTAEVNRQIRSLVPGQTLRGEIVSRNGGEIQIRISEDMVLNAKVDQSIHLDIGQNVTFEVKSNGAALSLSPLFTNISADVNVLKALEMAGLPVNETSVSMTKQLMEAGLPVNRSSLQQIYREINSFPEYEVSDVINLHRLQLPVNETNLQQMAAYRNMNHQLLNAISDVLELLPQAAEAMQESGNTDGWTALYRALLPQMPETAETAEMTEAPEAVPTPETAKTPQETEADMRQAASEIAQRSLPEAGQTITEKALQEITEGTVQQTGPENNVETQRVSADVQRILGFIERMELSPQEKAQLTEQFLQLAKGGAEEDSFFKLAQNLLELADRGGQTGRAVRELFSDKAFQKLFTEQLKEQWTLRPEEVAQSEKVEELYRRMDRQLKGLQMALDAGGQGESAAFKAVTNLSQNLDFMNQINQMYSYIQLPLQLKGSDAHGDLYVYTNKRSLAENDGKVSALLHLDMEHLGALDVYVTMESGKVATKFTVADDATLDFLETHMDILTQRLKKRGYDCSVSMTTAEKKEPSAAGGLAPLLQQTGGGLVTRYAFDVRT